MIEVNLDSGAILRVQLADFEDSIALFDSIVGEAIGVQIGDAAGDLSMSDLFKGNVSQLKDVLFKVLRSKPVKEALWKCMASCTYQPPGEEAALKIGRATFQPDKTRGDYFPVAGEVAVFNLVPFFKNLKLPSSIQGASGPIAAAQKSATG